VLTLPMRTSQDRELNPGSHICKASTLSLSYISHYPMVTLWGALGNLFIQSAWRCGENADSTGKRYTMGFGISKKNPEGKGEGVYKFFPGFLP